MRPRRTGSLIAGLALLRLLASSEVHLLVDLSQPHDPKPLRVEALAGAAGAAASVVILWTARRLIEEMR